MHIGAFQTQSAWLDVVAVVHSGTLDQGPPGLMFPGACYFSWNQGLTEVAGEHSLCQKCDAWWPHADSINTTRVVRFSITSIQFWQKYTVTATLSWIIFKNKKISLKISLKKSLKIYKVKYFIFWFNKYL